jgi:hypothetical protein
MPRSDIDLFLSDDRAFDLVIPFTDDVELPPDIFDIAFHHRPERPVVDKTRHGTITFRGRPDETSPFCQINYLLIDITQDNHGSLCMSLPGIKKLCGSRTMGREGYQYGQL